MLKSDGVLNKSAEDLSSICVFFLYSSHNIFLSVFPLFFLQFIIFSFILYTIVFFTILISPFISSSEWNKKWDISCIVIEKTLILSQVLLQNQALSQTIALVKYLNY